VVPLATDANLILITSPFGMETWEWPGIFDLYNVGTRRTEQDDGIMYTTFNMMKMEVCQLPKKNAMEERLQDPVHTRFFQQ